MYIVVKQIQPRWKSKSMAMPGLVCPGAVPAEKICRSGAGGELEVRTFQSASSGGRKPQRSEYDRNVGGLESPHSQNYPMVVGDEFIDYTLIICLAERK